jgi:hypothetical protein
MAGLLLLWVASLGCSNAEIDRISAGGNILSGELEPWLVLNFQSYPDGVEPRDVVVRSHSEPLDLLSRPHR